MAACIEKRLFIQVSSLFLLIIFCPKLEEGNDINLMIGPSHMKIFRKVLSLDIAILQNITYVTLTDTRRRAESGTEVFLQPIHQSIRYNESRLPSRRS